MYRYLRTHTIMPPFLQHLQMKSIPYFFLVFLLLFSCQNEGKLTFEAHTFENESCSNCPEVSIAIPKALGSAKISKAINNALEEELISLLSFDNETEVSSRKDALQAFEKGYLELQKLYDDELYHNHIRFLYFYWWSSWIYLKKILEL